MDHTSTFSRPQLTNAARTEKQQIHYTVASARERLSRYWMASLKSSEFKALSFIIERTLPFGKRAEIIPLRHFTHGVWTRDGESVTLGTGMARRTVIMAVTSLLQYGLIVRRDRTPKKNGYAQDAYWFEINFNNFWHGGETMLRVPRRDKKKEREENEEGECNKRTGGVQKLHPKAIEGEAMEKASFVTNVTKGVAAATTPRIRIPKKKVERAKQAFDSVEEAARVATDRQRAKRAEKIKKAEAKLTLHNFNKMWETVHVRHYPSTPCNAISVRNFAILRSTLKTTKLRTSLLSFIEWLFDSYPSLRIGKRFSWINKNADYPALPTIVDPASMVRYMKHFIAAYDEQNSSGAVDRPIDWKDRAERLAEKTAKTEDELRKTADLAASLKAQVEKLERDKRALRHKTSKHSQIDDDVATPVRRVAVDLDSDDLGEWKSK